MTHAEIQNLLAAVPMGLTHWLDRPVGGVVNLPEGVHDTDDALTDIGTMTTLRGAGMGSTVLSARGPTAIKLGRGDQADLITIEDMTILNSLGDGIVQPPNTPGLLLRNLRLNTAGIPLVLADQMARIERVVINGFGRSALTYTGHNLTIDGLAIAHNQLWRQRGRAWPVVEVRGMGSISNSQFEGKHEGALLDAAGTWTLTGNWFEIHRRVDPKDKTEADRKFGEPTVFLHDGTFFLRGNVLFPMPGQPIRVKDAEVVHDGSLLPHIRPEGGGGITRIPWDSTRAWERRENDLLRLCWRVEGSAVVRAADVTITATAITRHGQ